MAEAKTAVVGQATLQVRLTFRFQGREPVGGTVETEHRLDGTTGAVAVGALALNYDELSPLRGFGIVRFYLSPSKERVATVGITIHDNVNNLYQVVIKDQHLCYNILPGVVGQPNLLADGTPYTFATLATSWIPIGGGIHTPPFLGLFSHESKNVSQQVNAFIVAKDPAKPETYDEVTKLGTRIDAKKGLVFDQSGNRLGYYAGNIMTYKSEFYARLNQS